MTPAETFYLTQGVLGVTVFVLGGVIIWQQRRIDSKDRQITDLQDKRVADSNGYSAAYIAVSKENVATSRDNLSALSLLQRSVDGLATALQKLLDK